MKGVKEGRKEDLAKLNDLIRGEVREFGDGGVRGVELRKGFGDFLAFEGEGDEGFEGVDDSDHILSFKEVLEEEATVLGHLKVLQGRKEEADVLFDLERVESVFLDAWDGALLNELHDLAEDDSISETQVESRMREGRSKRIFNPDTRPVDLGQMCLDGHCRVVSCNCAWRASG